MGEEQNQFKEMKSSFLSFEEELRESYFSIEIQGNWEKVKEIGVYCSISYRKIFDSFEFFLEIRDYDILLPLSKLEDPIFLFFLRNQFEFFLDITTYFWEMCRAHDVLEA